MATLIDDMQGVVEQPDVEAEQLDTEKIHRLAQFEAKQKSLAHPSLYNLAQDFDDDELKKIGERVYKQYQEDLSSRKEWEDRCALWIELYHQRDTAGASAEAVSWSSTESIPLLTEACNQFQARTSTAFFPNKTFVSAIPMRRGAGMSAKELMDRAERVGRHLSYQLAYEDRSYRRNKDALFLGVALYGSYFTKTYYDQSTGHARIDNVAPDDLVVPYKVGTQDIAEVDRKTHVINTTVLKTIQLKDSCFLLEKCQAANSQEQSAVKTAQQDALGITPVEYGDDDIAAAATLLEQHTWLEINSKLVPVIIWVDAKVQKVLRIAVRFKVDEDGNPTENYKPVEHFTHYKFLENPEGFYGLGMGHLLGDINSAANVILRQALDAGMLANVGANSGFISERLSVEGEDLEMELGKFIKVPDTTGDIQAGIYRMEFPGPNASLVQLGQYLVETGRRLASVTDAITGQSETVKQPTTILTEVEQSLAVFTSIQLRLAESMTDELHKIYEINREHLPITSYFIVNGVEETVTRDDYADDMLVQPVFDPRFATQSQKLARAQAELNATLQNPNNANRPDVIDKAYRRYFETIETDNIEELLPEPQEAPQVERFDDQRQENALFLMPAAERPLFDVFPDQDHQRHLNIIDEFMKSAYGQEIDPETAKALADHRQKHLAFLYLNESGATNEPVEQAGTAGAFDAMGPIAGLSGIDGLTSAQIQALDELGTSAIMGPSQPVSGPAAGNTSD